MHRNMGVEIRHFVWRVSIAEKENILHRVTLNFDRWNWLSKVTRLGQDHGYIKGIYETTRTICAYFWRILFSVATIETTIRSTQD